MNDARPIIISARPLDTASNVAYRWYTRTGSSDDNTVTADDNLICSVRDAAAASTVTGSDTA